MEPLFLDLTKAFDTVDHQILLSKISAYGLSGNSLYGFVPISLTENSVHLVGMRCLTSCQ